MKPLSAPFIPKDYEKELGELKNKYFAWKMEFSSKTSVANTGHITHYEIRGAEPHGNFVLVPGLASNTQIEPLMCAITYWSLKHRYNIYAIDSFLGDFQPDITTALAEKNTVPEFIDLMDVGLEIVSKISANKWTCVVGHSLGASGTLEVFNRWVQQNKAINFSGAILFAPFVIKKWHDFTKRFINHYQYSDLPEEEFYTKPVGLISPHDAYYTTVMRYVSVYPNLFDDIDKLKPRPDLMAQYNIPITLVAGGEDKKSPVEYMRAIYDAACQYSNSNKMKFVEFPTSRHSFIDQHGDWRAILELIRTQHTRAKRSKTK